MAANQAQKKQTIFFGLEVTRRCNLECPHCFTGSGGKSHAGPTREQVTRLFEQLVAIGARHIAFSGGEPLVRRDLEEMMFEGLALGMESYAMVTNGFAATPQRVKRLKKAGLVAAQVSIDGVDARDHCSIRSCSPKAYYRALRAVRLFRDARIAADIATILVGPNIGRAPEMVQLCQALGARKLRYCSFVPTGRAQDAAIQEQHAFDPERIDGFLKYLRSVRDSKPPPVDMVIDHGIGPWQADGRFQCVSGRHVAYITGEGDLYPCPSLMHEPFKVGNAFETDLAELVASPAMHRVRRLRPKDLAEPCGSCSNTRCSGGCRGAAFAATGDVHSAPAYCNWHRRQSAAD